VRGSLEEALNALLDAEADRICQATRYERSPERQDRRAGYRKILGIAKGAKGAKGDNRYAVC
jgi:transposase-like protein